MERLRSWMFVPGHSEKMLKKSTQTAVDVTMFDLEDGVVPNLKEMARHQVARQLSQARVPTEPKRYVRVNSVRTNWFRLDLDMIVFSGLDGIVVPKPEQVEDVLAADQALENFEQARQLPRGSVKMVLAIESANAVINAPMLRAASKRVVALMFGAEDFSKDIGLPAERVGTAQEFIYARSAIVMAAASGQIAAVDGVWPAIADVEGLTRDSVLARSLGFVGKSLVHPGQIATVNSVFSPTVEEIEFSADLVGNFEKAISHGEGSISFRGRLVDRPIYERARGTLRLAELISVRGSAQ